MEYLKINSKVLGFNIDTNFNDSFDALFFAKIADFPEKEVMTLLHEGNKIENEALKNRFGYH